MALIGIPTTAECSYRSGARHGPRHVRDQSSRSATWNRRSRFNPSSGCAWRTRRRGRGADLDRATLEAIERACAGRRGRRDPVVTGGDHTVTPAAPPSRAAAGDGPGQFDAHPDTWDRYSAPRTTREQFGGRWRRGDRRPPRHPGGDPRAFTVRGLRFPCEHGLEVIRIDDVKEQGWGGGRAPPAPRGARVLLVRCRPATRSARERAPGSGRSQRYEALRSCEGCAGGAGRPDVVEVSPPTMAGRHHRRAGANLLFGSCRWSPCRADRAGGTGPAPARVL